MKPYYSQGQQAAMNSLGMTKEAWGPIASRLGSFALRGLQGLAEKVMPALGRSAHNTARGVSSVYNGLVEGAQRPFESAFRNTGNKVLAGMRQGGMPQKGINLFRGMGEGVAKDMAAFGLFQGGVGALTADEGDRLNSFGRNFAAGAAGGALWRGGSNLARMGLRKGFGPEKFDTWDKAKFWGKGSNKKQWMMSKGLPGAAAMTAAGFAPTFEPPPPPQQQSNSWQSLQNQIPLGTNPYGY